MKLAASLVVLKADLMGNIMVEMKAVPSADMKVEGWEHYLAVLMVLKSVVQSVGTKDRS